VTLPGANALFTLSFTSSTIAIESLDDLPPRSSSDFTVAVLPTVAAPSVVEAT